MAKSGKISTVLLVVLVLFSLSSTTITYYYLNDERTKRMSLEKQLEEIQLVKKQLEGRLKISKDKINNINDRLSESKVRIDGLITQLNIEKTAKKQIILERDNLITQLDNKSTSLQELTDKLSKEQEGIKALEKQIAQLQSEKEPREEIDELLPEEIELGKIVVIPKEKPQGKILTVNKEYDFVVINLGKKDGIKSGQIFSIYREQIFNGDIQVVNVMDELSVANLLQNAKIDSIQKGNKVIIKE